MLIREITLQNLLSFGPDTPPLPLRNLNVIIGPNGAGKSNLIDAIGLLQAAPRKLVKPVRTSGGVRDWIWKGNPNANAVLEAKVNYPAADPIRHRIEFAESGQMFRLVDETIDLPVRSEGRVKGVVFYSLEHEQIQAKTELRRLPRDEMSAEESILSQIRDPDQFPEITFLSRAYEGIRVYREWSFGRRAQTRLPQKTDQPIKFLEPDGANLALLLNRLRGEPSVRRILLENLQELYGGIEDYDVSIVGGTAQVFLIDSDFKILATRLSDGTLRYLCLLAILCDPSPPPLVCIEEPELGLHPDIIPTLAKLLQEAATRTQLVVTTHSDILVDALSETPESVVVCERHDGQTVMKRLEPDKLAKWLKKYRLGELWIDGELGGKRW